MLASDKFSGSYACSYFPIEDDPEHVLSKERLDAFVRYYMNDFVQLKLCSYIHQKTEFECGCKFKGYNVFRYPISNKDILLDSFVNFFFAGNRVIANKFFEEEYDKLYQGFSIYQCPVCGKWFVTV